MSDSIIPTPSVELLVRMSHNIDFKDKILKIFGSGAKVAAIAGSANGKDLRLFASQLSAARRWMKFLKIMRSTGEILNPIADIQVFNSAKARPYDYMKLVLSKLEFVADIAQMVAEDVNTLHKGHFWTSGLGFKPIPNLSNIEDKAWWFWSVMATVNAYIELKEITGEYFASNLRLETCTDDSQRVTLKAENVGLKIKYYLTLFKFVKFACEVLDSSIALAPESVKSISPSMFELVSCCAGSVSAVSSLHKLFHSEAAKIARK